MFRKTKRHVSEGDFLFATFIEFVKCWGSGRRSRLFMESRKSGAFVNFSTFLGHPGMRRSYQQFKMASDEEPKVQDPKSNKEKQSKKKSKKKTERDNQRAAIFQKRKKDEAELAAAAATCSASSSTVVRSTPTPDKHFKFSEPLSENTSGLDDSAFMNLDGNVTLNQDKTSSEEEEDLETLYYDAIDADDSNDDSKDVSKDVSKDASKDVSKDVSTDVSNDVSIDSIDADDSKDDSRDDANDDPITRDKILLEIVNTTPGSCITIHWNTVFIEERMAEYEKTRKIIKQLDKIFTNHRGPLYSPALYDALKCREKEIEEVMETTLKQDASLNEAIIEAYGTFTDIDPTPTPISYFKFQCQEVFQDLISIVIDNKTSIKPILDWIKKY